MCAPYCGYNGDLPRCWNDATRTLVLKNKSQTSVCTRHLPKAIAQHKGKIAKLYVMQHNGNRGSELSIVTGKPKAKRA